ncbi:hypothetical protein L7F22_033730 [Adiantum nelumboides]|nr:hypothetical protein [Adiantum nelumboides]
MDLNNSEKGNKGGEKGNKKRQGTLLQWAGIEPSKINSKKSKGDSSNVPKTVSTDEISSLSLADRLELQRRIEARAAFQDDWLQKFDWLVYKEEEAKLYCKFCSKYPHHHSAYSKEGSVNFKLSNLKAHCRTNCHVNAMEAFLLEGKEGIQNSMKRAENFKDKALFTLFRVAYHMARKNYAFSGFTDMISLLQDCRVPYSTSLYNDDKACVEMVYCIGKCLMNSTLKRVFRSPFFGVLIDESNDISKHGHLIIYLSYLIDDCIPIYSFYGIVRVSDGTARSIFNVVVDELKKNDFDLSKLIAFGSDGCSTMTGSENGVATLFKKHVNPFLTSIHCVAHRAALAVSSVAKNLEIAITLEKLVNSIATHFNHSNKRIEELRISQKDLACPILRLEHTFDVRWLSRASAIGKVCSSLDAILLETKEKAPTLFTDLSKFENIYCLFFLADILKGMSIVSKLFQKEFVDVTTVFAIIQKEINLIQQYYIDPPDVDENELILDASGYTFLREYGPDKGFLFYLRGAIRGNKFFDIEIERDIFDMDLMRALEFQVSFAKGIIASLQERFADNSILGKLSILVPAQHPVLEKSLRDYGKSEAKDIASFYGKMKSLEIINSAALIDEDDFISEFRSFKQQAAISWVRFSLPDVAAAIACNATWRDSYPNILTICQIDLVQCSSTAICERGFSARTRIKTKLRNSMELQSLDALMKINIEGPSKLTETELEESIVLWGAKAHRHLFTSQGICSLILQ